MVVRGVKGLSLNEILKCTMLGIIIPVCSKNYFKTEQFSWGSEAFNLHLKYLELKRPTSVHWSTALKCRPLIDIRILDI